MNPNPRNRSQAIVRKPVSDISAHATALHFQRMFEALRLQREGLIAERDALADEVARLTWVLKQSGAE